MSSAISFKEMVALMKAAMTGKGESESMLVLARQVLERQVNTVLLGVPTIIVSNILIVIVTVLVLWDDVSRLHLASWAGGTGCVLVLLAYSLTWKNTKSGGRSNSARNRAWFLEIVSATRGLALGAAMVAFFPVASPVNQVFLGVTAAAIMCGGAFALAPLYISALLFAGIVGTSSITALLMTGVLEMQAMGALTLVFIVFLSSMIVDQGRMFVAHTLSEIKTREQSDTIAILLREFEENSSDWLWQTCPNGRFISVSDRFSEAAGYSVKDLENVDFAKFFGEIPENKPVIKALQAGSNLFDAVVNINVDGAPRSWSLTAKPVTDSSGEFAGYRGVAADITDKLRSEVRLENLAHFDQLTGLANRSAFTEVAMEAFGENPLETIGLLIVDLNGFKSINDTLGHPVGDSLLRRIGRRMKLWSNENRFVARLGGDEFAVLLTNHTEEMAAEAASELLAAFDAPFEVDPHKVAIGAGIGIAFAGEDVTDPAELMKNADLALYASKAKKGRQYSFFNPDMAEKMLRRQKLELQLRNAAAAGEFSLRYQPVVDMETHEVRAFEALLRWDSAEFGPVSPNEFIPIAEDCGLIVGIGEWVLETATQEAANWPRDVQVTVNISPAQLRDNKLTAFLVNCLDKSGLLPSQLVAEITEGVFLEASDHINSTLHHLLDLGVQIALDDFGTGYSSLSYLRSFPFSKVKIDKSFVDDIETSAADIAIVRAIVDMATGLGFEVVAEGVETQGQLDALKGLGCDYVQGYFFASPQVSGDLIAMTGTEPDWQTSVAANG